jgi:hypothetical protein
VAEVIRVAAGTLTSEDSPREELARNGRNVGVGGLIVTSVHLVHILLLEDVQVYHDFPDESNFFDPQLPLDHSYPQYGHPRALSHCPTDQSKH